MKGRANNKYCFPKLIVGDSIEALLQSYHQGIPCVYYNDEEIFELESNNGLNTQRLTTALINRLSMSGLLPFGEIEKHLRKRGDKYKIISKNTGASYDLEVGELQRFDRENYPWNLVVDTCRFKYTLSHEHEHFKTDNDKDPFMNEVFFYKEPLGGISISYLTNKQLQKHDFSHLMLQYKMREMFKDLGIQGLYVRRPVGKGTYRVPKIIVTRKLYKKEKYLVDRSLLETKSPKIKRVEKYFGRLDTEQEELSHGRNSPCIY